MNSLTFACTSQNQHDDRHGGKDRPQKNGGCMFFHRVNSITIVAILIWLLVPSVLSAQGWTQLLNTNFNSVAVPNGFTSTFAGHTMPGVPHCELGPTADWAECNYKIITQWSSAWTDTKRNRLCFWGGGHNGPTNNSITCLDLQTPSTSIATCGGQTCSIYSNCSGSPCSVQANATVPTMTRINDPSVYADLNCTPNYDGTPLSLQSYGSLIYLPRHDKYFMSGDACYSASVAQTGTWIFDPVAMTWTSKATAPSSASSGRFCTLDPTTAHESVLCVMRGVELDRYDYDADTWTTLNNSLTTGYAGTSIADPDRRRLYFFGTSALWSVSLDSPYAGTDLTGSTTGCTNLLGYTQPGLQWDPSLHRVVYYVPATAAAPTVADNIIGIFDPATLTCVEQPLLPNNGPAADSSQLNTNQGINGRFAYFPALGEYIWYNNAQASGTPPGLNAYAFKLNATATHGLGSSTLTCVDRDGDGYGTGPGCTGPDADDQDASVHTTAQFLAKWTDIPTGLKHLGYSPTHIWYVSLGTNSPPGNDSTGVVDDAARPFLTCCGSGKANPAAGDMVMVRGGTYHITLNGAPSGTSGLPTIFMAYPGELPYFTGNPSGIDMFARDYYVVDGVKFSSVGSNACMNLSTVTHFIIRHDEAFGCEWGIDSEESQELSIEDSVMHDSALGGQHGVYLTNHNTSSFATNIFLRRTLFYNNLYNGLQFNGKFTNAIVEQNYFYANSLYGISLLTGTSNSTFRNNVLMDNGRGGLQIVDQEDYCLAYDPSSIGLLSGGCPYDQTNNTFQNTSVFNTSFDPTLPGAACSGGPPCNQPFALVENDPPYLLSGTSSTIPSSLPQSMTFTVSSYNSGTSYSYKDGVVSSGLYYISLENSNLGNTPVSSPSAWQVIPPPTWANGQRIRVTEAGSCQGFNCAKWVEGLVTGVSLPNLTINVDTVQGTGTFTDWQINLPRVGNVGGNTFQNITALTPGFSTGTYPAFIFPNQDAIDVTYAQTSHFGPITFSQDNQTGGTSNTVLGFGANYGGGGYVGKTCAQLTALMTTGSVSGCQNFDPKFVAANYLNWATPALFDLRLASGSPAISNGSVTPLPMFDVLGTPLDPTAPNLGAFQGSGPPATAAIAVGGKVSAGAIR